MKIDFFNAEIKEDDRMQHHRFPEEHREDRIKQSLMYWIKRQSQVNAERPLGERAELEHRFIKRIIAEEIARLRAQETKETVTYRDDRFFKQALVGGSLLRGVVSDDYEIKTKTIGGRAVDVVSFK